MVRRASLARTCRRAHVYVPCSRALRPPPGYALAYRPSAARRMHGCRRHVMLPSLQSRLHQVKMPICLFVRPLRCYSRAHAVYV